jgi:hypothetical protein
MSSRAQSAVLLAALMIAAGAGAGVARTPFASAAQPASGVAAQVQATDGGQAVSASRVDARAALSARIDSLAAEHERYMRLLAERDSARAIAAPLRTDTIVIGPFLFVNREPAPQAAINALHDAWRAYEPMVGMARTRLDGIVISWDVSAQDLAAGGSTPTVHRYHIRETGRDHEEGAWHAVAAALVGVMPADMRDWLGGSTLYDAEALVWAYRDLATSASIPLRRCHARDMGSCMLALTGDAARLTNTATRISLLQHALEVGGSGSFARLVEGPPGAAGRLARAADRPIDEVMLGWRDRVQRARPQVHAGIARAGLWSLLWLLGLGLLAMRSTRWRLG